jgi:hypothetical protein
VNPNIVFAERIDLYIEMSKSSPLAAAFFADHWEYFPNNVPSAYGHSGSHSIGFIGELLYGIFFGNGKRRGGTIGCFVPGDPKRIE